jgi:hypothetical protein
MHPDLVKVTEIFLIPSSFLVAALGTADTNPHRFGASLLGLIVSVLWLVCSWDAHREALTEPPARQHSVRLRILAGLPWLFVAGWLTSAVIHALLWNRPLGG